MTQSIETHMVLLTKAEIMLAQVDKADEALKLADMAEAARVWARKAGAGTNLVNHATMIKARALKRMADVVTAGQKSGEIAKAGGDRKSIIPRWYNGQNLVQLGITSRKLQQARKLDKLSEADIKRVVAQADADDREVTYNELITLAKQGAQDKKRAIKRARETEQEVEREARNFKVKRGQRWTLGRHTVMCGDGYDPADLIKLTGRKPDAFVSDPPYGIDYSPDWKKSDGRPSDFRKIIGDDQAFDPKPFLNFDTVLMFGANYFSDRLPLGGWLCWDKRLDEIKDAMFGAPFELAWFKSSVTTKRSIMVRCLHGGVINADTQEGLQAKRWHATQKPVLVMEEILQALVKPGAMVLDAFAGSGSTLLACERTGHICCAMEIDPEYCNVILQRWFDATGEEPQRAQ